MRRTGQTASAGRKARSTWTCLDRTIKNSPEWNPTAAINREYEARLYDYYGRPVGQRPSGRGAAGAPCGATGVISNPYAPSSRDAMKISPLAGKPPPPSMLVDVPQAGHRLLHARSPIPRCPAQRVAFGTSGHRGSAFDGSFNEGHILAISAGDLPLPPAQGHRRAAVPRHRHARAVGAGVRQPRSRCWRPTGSTSMLAARDEYTPTPVVSHAILTYNRGRKAGLADGIVITPSHNPPDEGGFKYNPPKGGPADTEVTELDRSAGPTRSSSAACDGREADSDRARRCAPQRRTATTISTPTSATSATSSTWRRSAARACVSASDPLGGAGVHYWGPDRRALRARPDGRERRRRSDLSLHDRRLGRAASAWTPRRPTRCSG